MATPLSPEEHAELENARLAALEIARDGHTGRRCLQCGGELVVIDRGSGYIVRCTTEGRDLLRVRG